MFPTVLVADANQLLAELRGRQLKLATAESCTGGLVCGLLTEVSGASDVLACGFVVYSNAAKTQMLGIPEALIASFGAVSREVAIAMAEGALRNSAADVAVSVTGVAGPRAVSAEKPVGLVHLAAIRTGGPSLHQESRFDPQSRSAIRLASVAAALALVRRAIVTPS